MITVENLNLPWSKPDRDVNMYGEVGYEFTYTTGMLWWKETHKVTGCINYDYTKFVKE